MTGKARTYCRMVEIMDRGIGGILDALGDEAANTMVVFTSDNGSQFPQFFPRSVRAGKYGLFDGGVRVPFTMSWPARLTGSGQAYGKPVSTLDLLPTIAAAAGAPVTGYPGVNLVPYLNDPQRPAPHDRLYWRYVVDQGTERENSSLGDVKVAIRSGRYKYIRHIKLNGSTTELLYNVATDAKEQDNLAADPGHAGVLARLVAEHNAWNRHNRLIEGFEHLRPQADRKYEPDGAIEYGGNWRIKREPGSQPPESAGSYLGTADQNNPRVGRVMFAATHYTNVTATTKVRLDTRGHAGLIVRGRGAARDNLTGYVVRLASPRDGAQRVVLQRVVNGTAHQVAVRNRPIEVGRQYELNVTVTGGTVVVKIGGKWLID